MLYGAEAGEELRFQRRAQFYREGIVFFLHFAKDFIIDGGARVLKQIDVCDVSGIFPRETFDCLRVFDKDMSN